MNKTLNNIYPSIRVLIRIIHRSHNDLTTSDPATNTIKPVSGVSNPGIPIDSN